MSLEDGYPSMGKIPGDERGEGRGRKGAVKTVDKPRQLAGRKHEEEGLQEYGRFPETSAQIVVNRVQSGVPEELDAGSKSLAEVSNQFRECVDL